MPLVPKIVELSFSPVSQDGDLYPLDEFKEFCKTAVYLDSDGYGYFAKEEDGEMLESNKLFKPSELTDNPHLIPEWATHVVWHSSGTTIK